MRRFAKLALLLALPLVLVLPAVLSGALFLPQAPRGLEPLASEAPEDAAVAWQQANYLASDRLFPILTDELTIQAALRAGSLPLWNAKQGLGLPLVGGTLVGPLYPPNWIGYATDPVRAGPWLAALSLFLAGLGAWSFLERRGTSFGAAAIGALALQIGGFALANLHYRMKLDAALWLPWTLWALDGLAARKPRAGLALAGSIAASFLAGFPTIAAFGLAAAVLYALVRRFADGVALPLGRACAFAACGLAIASVQLVPTFDAASESLRAERTVTELTAESLPLASTLGLVVPDLAGSPNEPLAAPHLPVPWWLASREERDAAQNANPLEWQLFAGVATLALAVAGLVCFPRDVRAFALLALVALGFVQGWPLVRELYRLPLFDVGAPARAASVLWVVLPLAAGFGVEALLRRHPRALWTVLALVLGLAACGGLFRATLEAEAFAAARELELAERHGVTLGEVRALIAHDDAVRAAERLAHAAERLALVALSTAVAASFLVWSRRRETARAPWLPLFAVLLVEGVAASAAHLVPRAASLGAPFPSSPALAALAAAAGDGRVVRLDESGSGIDDVLVLARPNLPEAYGIADLTPYVVFSQRRLVELVRALDPLAGYRTGISRLSLEALAAHPLLDALDVRAVLSRSPRRHPALEPVLERERFHVYRRTSALGRARVVAPRFVADGTSALAELASPRFLPARECVVVAADAHVPLGTPREPAGPESDSAATARVVEFVDSGFGEFEARVDAPAGGWLVVSAAYHAGWNVTIDGEPAARVAPADHALLGVELPARNGLVVRARFLPRSYVFAACLAVLGFVCAILGSRIRPARLVE
ncbi:MAG: hypothetical protein L6Q99_10985 [Planctomycetes bacterium]|nr:hypothetical protein [Planctomycetota bacterium]